MNLRTLTQVTLFASLSSLPFALSGCSADSTNTPPGGSGGATSTAASSTAVSASSGGASSASSTTSSGNACDAPPADGSAPRIDAFADNDHTIEPNEGRMGYW
jgi:hypothetical protein